MIYGIDYLAGVKYQKVILDEHPAGWGAGFFARTFGPALKTVDALLATGRCPAVRIQMLWSDTHQFSDSDIPALKKIAKQYEVLAKKYKTVRIYLSPFCEHNLKNPDKYLDIVKAHAPSCIPVNTIWKGSLSKRYINEVHGNKSAVPKGHYFYSYDGQNALDADVENDKVKYKDAGIFFWWSYQCNGKKKEDDTTPRPDRKAWLSNKQADALIYMNRSREKVSIPKGWIWKSYADQQNTPASDKDCKPVLITPPNLKFKEIKLVCDNGQVIDRFGYYGPWKDHETEKLLGHRYYANLWGFELSDKAKKIQNESRVVDLICDNKKYGKINPAFRCGTYK